MSTTGNAKEGQVSPRAARKALKAGYSRGLSVEFFEAELNTTGRIISKRFCSSRPTSPPSGKHRDKPPPRPRSPPSLREGWASDPVVGTEARYLRKATARHSDVQTKQTVVAVVCFGEEKESERRIFFFVWKLREGGNVAKHVLEKKMSRRLKLA